MPQAATASVSSLPPAPAIGETAQSRAFELLMACVRAGAAQDSGSRVSEFAAGRVDWGCWQEMAGQHGVLPLAAGVLLGTARDAVPMPVQERLLAASRTCGARSLLLSGKLIQAIELLTRHGVRAIPFKGPVLAASLYGSICQRGYFDIDILISSRDQGAAVSLLSSIGYVPSGRPLNHHLPLVDPHTGVCAELQWDLGRRWQLASCAEASALDFEHLWERRRLATLCSHPLADLSGEDALLALSVHGARHCWDRLMWICDIARLVLRERSLNWAEVCARADACHCRRRVLLALLLASTMLNVPLPVEVRDRWRRDSALDAAAAHVRSGASRTPDASLEREDSDPILAESLQDLLRVRYFASIHDRRRDRARLWLRYLATRLKPNPADRDFFPLPDFLSPAWYLLRPLRLLGVYRPAAVWRGYRNSGPRAG